MRELNVDYRYYKNRTISGWALGDFLEDNIARHFTNGHVYCGFCGSKLLIIEK